MYQIILMELIIEWQWQNSLPVQLVHILPRNFRVGGGGGLSRPNVTNVTILKPTPV